MDTSVGIVRTHWSGTSGGPGISQFCFAGDDSFADWDGTIAGTLTAAVRTFWDTNKNTLPNEINLTVDPTVDIYGIVTGTLEQSFSAASAPAVVTGTNTGAYAMPSGAKINFRTTTIANGRRVRGGVFIVPCGSDVFDASGNVSSTPRTNWVNAALAMRTAAAAANLTHIVWSRPTTTTSNDGGGAAVTSYDVPTKGAILRGRRD
jgi:hypothetical protein